MRKKLDRWRALPGDERRLLAGLVVLLPVIGVSLRLLGVRRTYLLLGGPATGTTAGQAELDSDSQILATRLGTLVNIASRHGPYTASCLRQSLALRWLLRRRGLPAEVRVGVGRTAGRMQAHAWVEVAGQVINDHPAVIEEYAAYQDLDRRLLRSLRTSSRASA